MRDNIDKSCAGIYVFEGIDNVGKTSIIKELKTKICETTKYDCTSIAFPGDEPKTLGSLIYDIHHHNDKYFDRTINAASLQLMHVASHIDLIQRKLIGEYSSSKIVLMDRCWWSTYAYGLAEKLSNNIVDAIIAPELIYWGKVNVTQMFLLERENRKSDFDAVKDATIIQTYRALAEQEKKCTVVSNDERLEDAVNQIYDYILGV